MDAVLVDSRDACEVFFTRAADHPVETRAVGLPDQTEPHLGHGQDRSRRVIARAMMSPALAAFFRAAAFLTRLPPVGRAFEGGPHPLGKDVLAFPLVGLLAALPAAFLLAFLPEAGLSALVAAALAVAATILVTGALHEDGLGDVADGLFGHHGRERALAIMKDSRVGSYGVIALVLSLIARWAALAALMPEGPWMYPEDQVSDASERLLATEITREQLYRQLHEELPYDSAVRPEKYIQRPDGSVEIHQQIVVMRDNQRAIVLGKGGSRIKEIGKAAREELSELLGQKVHLFLHVKTDERWSEDKEMFEEMGLDWKS